MSEKITAQNLRKHMLDKGLDYKLFLDMVDKQNNSVIARQLGIHRITVRKYRRAYEEGKQV